MTAATYRTLRQACGLSQREAAIYHDVNERTVRAWEGGRFNPPQGAVDELTDLLHSIIAAVHGSPLDCTIRGAVDQVAALKIVFDMTSQSWQK